MRAFIALMAASVSMAAIAERPGTRLRTGPGPAQPIGPVERDAQRCDAMQGQAKERCLRELRAAMRALERNPHEGPGPEAVGGTPAGTGATTGTNGGSSSIGSGAPR